MSSEALRIYRIKIEDTHSKTLNEKVQLGTVMVRRGRLAEGGALIIHSDGGVDLETIDQSG